MAYTYTYTNEIEPVKKEILRVGKKNNTTYSASITFDVRNIDWKSIYDISSIHIQIRVYPEGIDRVKRLYIYPETGSDYLLYDENEFYDCNTYITIGKNYSPVAYQYIVDSIYDTGKFTLKFKEPSVRGTKKVGSTTYSYDYMKFDMAYCFFDLAPKGCIYYGEDNIYKKAEVFYGENGEWKPTQVFYAKYDSRTGKWWTPV